MLKDDYGPEDGRIDDEVGQSAGGGGAMFEPFADRDDGVAS